MTTQPKHTPHPIITRPIAFGVYSATPAFRAIDQHSCVCFADDMGLIAVTGRAEDKEAQRWSEFFAAAPETAAERDQLRAVIAELVTALQRCIAALVANGAPNCEAVKESSVAIARATGAETE